MFNKIKQSILKICKLDIVKVFSFTSLSTLVKMMAGFISVKVVSVIIGPAGVALIGQLNNFSSMIMIAANGGITGGITRNIAAYRDDDEAVKSYIGTSVKITLFLSAICGIFLVLASRFLSKTILQNGQYAFVFVIFGVTLFFYSLNMVVMAIINGFKEFKLYVKISMISSIVGLALSLGLVVGFGVSGALINAVTSQTFIFIVTLIMLKKYHLKFMNTSWLFAKFDKQKMIVLFKFSLMTIVAAFITPSIQLLLRSYIIKNFSMTLAGCWEGMNRISGMYLMVITSSFGVYYMPRLAELKNNFAIKKEIITAYKVIVPCLVVGLSLIFLFRDVIIHILFSSEFIEMSSLFVWQLLGDFFKITSCLLAYVMSAKAMVKAFVVTEIVFNFSYLGFALLFSNVLDFGIVGINIGYMCNYIVYLVAMYFVVWRRLGKCVVWSS